MDVIANRASPCQWTQPFCPTFEPLLHVFIVLPWLADALSESIVALLNLDTHISGDVKVFQPDLTVPLRSSTLCKRWSRYLILVLALQVCARPFVISGQRLEV